MDHDPDTTEGPRWVARVSLEENWSLGVRMNCKTHPVFWLLKKEHMFSETDSYQFLCFYMFMFLLWVLCFRNWSVGKTVQSKNNSQLQLSDDILGWWTPSGTSWAVGRRVPVCDGKGGSLCDLPTSTPSFLQVGAVITHVGCYVRWQEQLFDVDPKCHRYRWICMSM